MILSVIVPIFNVEKYLCQCIDSILHQTLQDIEIILVDDGSTDKSAMICDGYANKDSRIKVFHQENKGLVEARKYGVELSSSPYITFVDSDDFIDKEAYSYALDSMEEGIDVICFGIIRYYEGRKCNEVQCTPFAEKRYSKKDIKEEIIPQMIWKEKDNSFGLDPSLCTKIIKKDLLLKSYSLLKVMKFYYGEDSAIIYPVINMADSMEIKSYSYYYHRHRDVGECPIYIQDNDFFHKLYIVYKHLNLYFYDNDVLIKQIEQFFMYSVNLKRKAYGENYQITKYLFPFDQVEKNQKIVLYGAGVMGNTYYHQLLQVRYCKVVLWVDKNYQKYNVFGVKNIDNISTADYDKIVIAIENLDVAEDVRDYLMEKGIEFGKIILPRKI